MFKTLRGRIIASYFLVVLVSLLLTSLVSLFFLSRYAHDKERDDLLRQVGAIAEDLSGVSQLPRSPLFPQEGQPEVEEPEARRVVRGILNTEAEVLEAKLMLVAPDGRVVAESRTRPTFGEKTLELPPEIFSEKGPRITEKFFEKLENEYLFATAPTRIERDASGYLIAIKPVEELGSAASTLIRYVVLAGLIALGISMLVALYLSGAISRPLKAVTLAARKMADGDYRQEVVVKGSDETAELARDFNLMAERVRTAYELQRDFVGNVSHELRTPLTSIEGFSQAILDGVIQGEEKRRRSLQIINDESKRLVRVLRDLLLLSQIDAGELHPEKRKVDLVDLLRKLSSIFERRAADEGIDMKVSTPEGALEVNTDPDRLERVLTNLMDNAIKYTDPGGSVVLSATGGEGVARISIADTGQGIEPELLPRLFERFYRVEESRATKHGGAGLGLSICKELVGTLGGTIKVQSLPGQGTTFTVTLPL